MPAHHRPDPTRSGHPEHVADPADEAAPGEGDSSGLSARDRRILDLESRTFRYVGAKERAIREQIGISRTAYYVRLNALLEDPDALRAAPSIIRRLRDLRTSQEGPAGTSSSGRVA